MAQYLEKKKISAEEVLQLLEEDTGNPFYVNDSSSDEEDLLCHNTLADSDSDYRLTLSESEEDSPPSERPGQSTQTKELVFQPVKATLPHQSSPSPTTEKKRGRPPPVKSSPAPKKASKKKRTQSEEREMWHDGEDEDTKPDPPRFMPARTPGPTFDTTTSWSPLSLFQLFFSASVMKTIMANTNAKADEKKKSWSKIQVGGANSEGLLHIFSHNHFHWAGVSPPEV